MKKKIASLLAIAMLTGTLCVPSFAADSAIKQSDSGFFYIEASGDQIALSAHSADKFIQTDGLYFKDLNGNGTLDVYEDWRQDVDARVADLLSQMTLDEEIGLLWHASTGGTFTSMYPYTEDWLYSNEPTYTDQDGNCYVPMYHSIISDNVTTYLHNVNGTPDTLIYENNAFQEIAESARLGVPVVLSCDRSYNTWAGMVNMPNYACPGVVAAV